MDKGKTRKKQEDPMADRTGRLDGTTVLPEDRTGLYKQAERPDPIKNYVRHRLQRKEKTPPTRTQTLQRIKEHKRVLERRLNGGICDKSDLTA